MDVPLGQNRPEINTDHLKISYKLVIIIGMSNYYFNKSNKFW